MWARSLTLKNFRNYENLSLDFDSGVHFIVGDNGHGKTNIVEGISLLAYLRSFRTNNLRDLVRFQERFFHVRATVQTEDEVKVEQYFGIEDRKNTRRFSINGVEKSLSETFGTVKVVLFSPEQINLLLLGPDQRRRYLNFLLLQIRPRIWNDIFDYQKALKQRNALLYRIHEGLAKESELDFWNERVIVSGSKIIAARRDIIQQLNKTFAQHFVGISQQNEEAIIQYKDGIGLWKEKENTDDIEGQFSRALEASMSLDRDRKTTNKGPHRDNWEIQIHKKNILGFGSRGELRTAVLAMKFAERDVLTDDERPIILLDDVFSELDASRSTMILGLLEGYQAFITSCELEDLPKMQGDATLLTVKDATVKKS